MKEVSKKGNHRNSERFSTGIGVLMATLGSAVGLGNIWKFPYLTGSNGVCGIFNCLYYLHHFSGFPNSGRRTHAGTQRTRRCSFHV